MVVIPCYEITVYQPISWYSIFEGKETFKGVKKFYASILTKTPPNTYLSSPAPYLTHYAVQSRMALIIGSFLTGILLCKPTQFDNVNQRTGSSLDKVSADCMPSPHEKHLDYQRFFTAIKDQGLPNR